MDMLAFMMLQADTAKLDTEERSDKLFLLETSSIPEYIQETNEDQEWFTWSYYSIYIIQYN